MTIIESLEREVERFRAWDASLPDEGRSGEWESYYEQWDDLYAACREYLATPIAIWSDAGVQLLLYAIGRDNGCEVLAEELTQEQVFTLSRAALASADRDAKWQLATTLSRCPGSPEADALLCCFAADPHEYVRRRALMALAEIGSPATEELAVRAWESGEQYQRMACLHALYRIGSGRLEEFLRQANQDGREYLVLLAQQIRNREGEYQER
jgi:HEAT repeat protein